MNNFAKAFLFLGISLVIIGFGFNALETQENTSDIQQSQKVKLLGK